MTMRYRLLRILVFVVLFIPNFISPAQADIIFNAALNTSSDGFSYSDDVFGTSRPGYATGRYVSSGGFSGGGVKVVVGGVDDATVAGMSGGWSRSFSLASQSLVTVSLRYRLVMKWTYESDECSRALMAIDGVLLSADGTGVLKQFCGSEPKTNIDLDSGWQRVSVEVSLLAGPHTITVGGLNTLKTRANEFTELYFDDLRIIIGSVVTEPVFPQASWAVKSPSEVGLDDAKLEEFILSVGGVGCIIKDGYMIKSWGEPNSKGDWGSASKPVISTLLFFAVDEGLIDSVDSLVYDWGWTLVDKDQTMTFRHLANMVSGYARIESPGMAWAYNDFAIKLYALTLQNVFEQSLNEAALQRLADLQLQDGSLFSSREGLRVYTTPRDFARIGWLWLNKGLWDGVQVIPQSFFNNFMKPGVPNDLPRSAAETSDYLGIGTHGGGSDQTPFGPGIYGFNWWFNDKVGTSDHINWPDAPADTFQANGHWNQEVMTVIPSLGIVVAARGNWGSFLPGDSGSGMNQNLKLLVEAAGAH